MSAGMVEVLEACPARYRKSERVRWQKVSIPSEQFQHQEWPKHITGPALWLNGDEFPVRFSLNPKAVVHISCIGEVVIEVPGEGVLVLEPEAEIAFRANCMGIEVGSLLAPLALAAADTQGIPVGHRCADSCLFFGDPGCSKGRRP